MNNVSKKISSEITELEREKELLIEEKSVLRKKIRDKKREISALKKRLKKAKKTERIEQEVNHEEKERNLLRTLLYLPVISITVVLSLIYANIAFPFADLGYTSTYYPLLIPFISFFIGLVCLIASIFYFAFYQLIQNYRKSK